MTIVGKEALSRRHVMVKLAVMILPIGRRHQLVDVLRENLRLAVSEQTLRRRAERSYQSPIVDDDHGIRNSIQDRAEMRLAKAEELCACRKGRPGLFQPITQEAHPSPESDKGADTDKLPERQAVVFSREKHSDEDTESGRKQRRAKAT
jgi:hypothetical protein